MRRFYWLMIVAVFAQFSCEKIEFDGSKKLIIKGKLVDESGKPIPNVPITAIGYLWDFELYDFSEDYPSAIAQKGVSDDNGTFQLILSDSNVRLYGLYFNNSTYEENTLQDFSQKTIVFDPKLFENFVCDLDTQLLHFQTVLRITYEPSPTSPDFTSFRLQSKDYVNLYNYNPIAGIRYAISSDKPLSLSVPQNSIVKIINANWQVDSFYVSNTPYEYTLKD